MHRQTRKIPTNDSKYKNQHMLTEDVNCRDMNLESMSVPNNSSDKEIQANLMEITASFKLTQIDEQPTREDNLLPTVLSTKSSHPKTRLTYQTMK